MVLKSEYGKVNTYLSSVALEYSFVSNYYNYTANIENTTYEYGDAVEGYEAGEVSSIVSFGDYYGENHDAYGFEFDSCYFSDSEGADWVNSDFGIIRIQGTIYIFNAE